MKKELKSNPFYIMKEDKEKDNLREYPLYPDSEDIYKISHKEKDINPEDISKTKEETKNWLGKKATPEQLGKAINLFPVIEEALKKNSKIKPAKVISFKEAESILLGERKAVKNKA